MPALALRDLQAGFWRSLHSGAPDPELTAIVLPTPMLAPTERIEIYQGMYVWRLHEVLREDYPKTHETLGDDFEAFVRRYLARHPSEHPSVRHLGGHLPTFLATDEATTGRPWLPDLARLELARVNAFDAPDAVPMRATDLCAVAPEAWPELRLSLIPALEIVRSAWPLHDLWATPTAADVDPRATTLRVWRQDFSVFHAAIDAAEEAAFAALVAGRCFAEICEVVAEHAGPASAAEQAGALLARWVEDGLIADRVA
ncbi:MAG: DNA-binding domain-containing protein [Candidatus Binatia bacterium]